MLDGAARAGCSLLRTWAFNDGGGWNALQTAPGVYDERVFAALDWLLQQCAARGLRLQLVLVNHWEDFGGVKVYVRCGRGPLPGSTATDPPASCASPPSARHLCALMPPPPPSASS